MLTHFFKDKEKWKKDAFNRIKNDLLSVKDNRFVQYGQSSTHLVCVYGKSQVGKTTLILNMIGLKDDECKQSVSDVLRGGVARGNSSTSTAIIYSQSDTEQYGINIKTIEGTDITSIKYYSPEEMKGQLQNIREEVESNGYPKNAILHIFIPQNYFSQNVSNDKIVILDLPGIESRNDKEKAHVESLMTRYIPLSSVCVITCRADTIQSLENEELPKSIDWKRLSHKFIVAITRSYSCGTIKSFFDKPREMRPESFCEFVRKRFKDELAKILGANNNTEFFPLDIGDSFDRLSTNELSNEEDREEIRQTRDAILRSLQDSIIKHKGESFLSAINDLKEAVNDIDIRKISDLNDELQKYEKIRKDQTALKAWKEETKSYKETEIENKEKKLNDLKMNLKNEIGRAISEFSQSLIDKVKNEVNSKQLFKIKKNGTYFCDKKKDVLKTIFNHLFDGLATCVVSKAQSLMEDNDFEIDFETSHIIMHIYNEKILNGYEDKLYPKTSGMWLIKMIKKISGDDCKISLNEAYSYIEEIKTIIQEETSKSIIDPCKERICNEIEILERNKKVIHELDIEISSIKKGIKEIEASIHKNEGEMKIVEEQIKRDQQTLEKYMTYAKECYFSQRDEIIKKINSDITPAEKMEYVLFLGVLDKEYKAKINI